MKEKQTVNQTFSLPIELVEELHKMVKNMERSAYVAELIREGLAKKKEELRKEYMAMAQDEEQNTVMKDWDTTLNDGLGDDFEDEW